MRSTDSLRLLHVTAPARVGGLESVVAALTTGLVERGHHVTLSCVVEPGFGRPALADRAEEGGVEVEVLTLPGRAYLSEYRAHRALMARTGTQLVHSHGYRPDVVAGQAARASGLPHVTTAHGFIGGSRRGRVYEWLQLRATRLASAAVAVSRPIAGRFREVGVVEERIATIPNAFGGAEPLPADEARATLGIEPGTPIIGWVGRFTPEKAPEVFLEALSRLRDRPWQAVLVGEGRDRPLLEQRVRALGLADRVHMPGIVPGAGRLVSAFDAWVMSSRTEGTPVALLEAMAAGVPIVTTAVGGIPDVVSPAEAWLVAPDDPAALGVAIASALSDADRSARGRAARARLQREFGLAPWLDRHEALYRSLIAAAGRRKDAGS